MSESLKCLARLELHIWSRVATLAASYRFGDLGQVSHFTSEEVQDRTENGPTKSSNDVVLNGFIDEAPFKKKFVENRFLVP